MTRKGGFWGFLGGCVGLDCSLFLGLISLMGVLVVTSGDNLFCHLKTLITVFWSPGFSAS